MSLIWKNTNMSYTSNWEVIVENRVIIYLLKWNKIFNYIMMKLYMSKTFKSLLTLLDCAPSGCHALINTDSFL